MSPLRCIKLSAVLVLVLLAASAASAQPPPNVRPYSPPPVISPPLRLPPQGLNPNQGIRVGNGLGLGSGTFGYSRIPYGGTGYGTFSNGYPSSFYGPYNGSYLNRPVVPQIHSPPAPTVPLRVIYPSGIVPVEPVPELPVMPPPVPPWGEAPIKPAPAPVEPIKPAPAPMTPPASNASSATITVIVNEGATVSFDGVASEQTGTKRIYTTPPIASGVEKRVLVRVSGRGGAGASSITIRVRAGEKATVDMTR
ncbi:MAG: TIGR03000 domain-containing protein [Planctomycetia bacterium]|nr:TIGR03000 domain-containing protein [Planctomycetia bacterium]